MTRLYQDTCFLKHETGRHPERPKRIETISSHLAKTGLAAACESAAWQPATSQQLQRVHSANYVHAVETYANDGGGQIEVDTVVSPQSYNVAVHAAGAVCDAVECVATSESQNALCLIRPPGHHAVQRNAMGFCLFNNIAIGARHAIEHLDLDRVLIVDWDVHHGNGTQDAFWVDEQVGFYSIHRWPFYPGTGDANETGSGAGLGTTLNIPIEFGTTQREYFHSFQSSLETFAQKINPQLILISAGFDAHRLDPVGSLGIETEDFTTLTQIVVDLAQQHCGGRVVSVLEGGYNVDVLPHCVANHLQVLIDASTGAADA